MIPRLEAYADVVVGDGSAAADVWLTDGHRGALSTEAPVVAHIHEAPWGDPAGILPGVAEAFDENCRAAAGQASLLLTGSQSGRSELIDRYGLAPDRVLVALNGVDHSVYNPDGPTPEPLLTARGRVGGRPYVLFVGSVLPRKNLPLLRTAMERLASDGLPHDLVVVAGPTDLTPHSDALLEAAVQPVAGRPVVNMAGVDEHELAAVMRGAAALCLPSDSEGFGMPVLEAMACGTPVVTSNRGSLPEVVGPAGVMCEPEIESLSAALRSVLADPEVGAQIGSRCRSRALTFTWDATATIVNAALLLAATRARGTPAD